MLIRTPRYEEVSLYGINEGPCKCGVKRKRTKKFAMTMDPNNRNPDGTLRSRLDCIAALNQQIQNWKQEPITCKNCATKQ